MKTIHVIFNAHIDPIWLWPWQSGLDEALATCRSACDRLDAHPEATFTRGEAWIYDEIERTDPRLFERIQKHIRSEQWEVVGGWWLQPDCNFPSGFAMERQIEIGKDYFLRKFGFSPRVAYNVDSFGHSASLPELMRAHGQDRYVMMRPQPHEMDLPACLFRWRGYENGPEVIVFRIVESYVMGGYPDERRIRATLAQLPEGIDHAMLFAGAGDHGGGPTERQIRWLLEHGEDFEDVKLVFSSTSRFFDAIWDRKDSLPLVVGELQQHAIGCYSVYRPIKTEARKAEHLLRQAEIFTQSEPSHSPSNAKDRIQEGWKRVCFAHFHDIMGGTCIPSAYAKPLAQLGWAQDTADELLQEGLRRKLSELADDPMQRIVLYNASDTPYDGPVEFMPWLDGRRWGERWDLLDENGEPVPYQIIASEAIVNGLTNLLLPIRIEPSGMRVLRINFDGVGAVTPSSVMASEETLTTSQGLRINEEGLALPDGAILPLPEPILYEDKSDTWSHNMDRYGEEPLAHAVWIRKEVVDNGPLMASWIRLGVIGESGLEEEWRVHSDGYAELRLKVNWRERRKLLKLLLPTPWKPSRRLDGIMNGWLERPSDGKEMPLRDAILLDESIGVVSPDVFALDATRERIRFTLLRSAIMAHHIPHNGVGPRLTFSDQGEHTFRFRFFSSPQISATFLDVQAAQMHRAPIVADLTRGMPCRVRDLGEK
jgi:alpha-mannosidase